MSDDRPLYVISVAAELAGVHPQTLRIYERKGLVRPQRTRGGSRRYSERDVEMLRSIQRLTQDVGVNLAGVKRILEMQAEMEELQRQMDELRAQLERRRAIAMPGRVIGAQIVPLRSVVAPPWQRRDGAG
jgi:MerR family transcriptional regulator/heat shock protein HspR